MTHSKDIEEFREKFPELWAGHLYPNGGANLNRVNEVIEQWLTSRLEAAEKRGAEAEREKVRAICNRCKTERGLARALANHLTTNNSK